MLIKPMDAELNQSIDRAADYLLHKQQSDGTWRDYCMKPGESYAWITAVVGLSLIKPPSAPSSGTALDKALQAINRLCTSNGWGYNSTTPCDADCNAWCIRFITSMNYYIWPELLHRYFLPYILPDGQVRTFHDSKRFGAWAEPHQDVTPLVGLALYQINDSWGRLICNAAITQFCETRPWHSFWWNTDSYAVAHNIELLSLTGLLTDRIKAGVLHWLAKLEEPESAFEIAQRLSIAAELAPFEAQYGIRYVRELLKSQKDDGSWPGSQNLLLPLQFPNANDDEVGARAQAYQDQYGLMTTACAVYAIKQWLGKTGPLSIRR